MGMRIANKNPLTNELNHLMIYDLKNAENLIEQHSQVSNFGLILKLLLCLVKTTKCVQVFKFQKNIDSLDFC